MPLDIPFSLWIRRRCLQLDTSGLVLSTVLRRIIILVSHRACNASPDANHLCVLPRNVQIRDIISEAMPSIPTHSDISKDTKHSFDFHMIYLNLILYFKDPKRFYVNASATCDSRELFLLYILTQSNKILHIHLLSGDHASCLALILFDISAFRA